MHLALTFFFFLYLLSVFTIQNTQAVLKGGARTQEQFATNPSQGLHF